MSDKNLTMWHRGILKAIKDGSSTDYYDRLTTNAQKLIDDLHEQGYVDIETVGARKVVVVCEEGE